MAACAHPADTFDKSPGIARVAPFEDHFQTAPHGAGRHRVADHVVFIEVHLDPHVAFDPRHRIDHHALAGVVHRETLRLVNTHDYLSPFGMSEPGLLRTRESADAAACAATTAPTAPAAAIPTSSAFFSTPNCLMSVRRS